MSDVKLPLSRRHLDIAIERLASRFGESQRIRRAVANTIVAQLMPDCVIKGGSSLKFRYGDIATRVTKDMDAAQGADLDAFITRLDEALHGGWSGFTGHVVRRKPATPEDVPPAYVMHPFDVKLEYNRKPFPVGRGEGPGAIVNLYYLHAMKSVADMADAAGEPEIAAYWRKRAGELGGRIVEKFWVADKGLMADDIGHTKFSEHAQCFAILGDVLGGREANSAAMVFRESGAMPQERRNDNENRN